MRSRIVLFLGLLAGCGGELGVGANGAGGTGSSGRTSSSGGSSGTTGLFEEPLGITRLHAPCDTEAGFDYSGSGVTYRSASMVAVFDLSGITTSPPPPLLAYVCNSSQSGRCTETGATRVGPNLLSGCQQAGFSIVGNKAYVYCGTHSTQPAANPPLDCTQKAADVQLLILK